MKEGKKSKAMPREIACSVRFLPEVLSAAAFISVYLCSSVDSLLPHERQLRGTGAAGGLEIRNCVAGVEPHAGAAILDTGRMPRRGNRLYAACGDGVLRSGISGI